MSNWNYWKELPYHGQPPDGEPKNRKPKRKQSQREIRRNNIIGILKLLLICGIIFCVSYFAAGRSLERALGPALFVIAIFIFPFGLSAGVNAWNRYLRADDMDEPEDLDERRKETSPIQEDKHEMAEDYLAQLKWDADHLRDPNRGVPPVRFEPKWKYKPIFRKIGEALTSSSTVWGVILLIALLVVAGYSLFIMLTTSEFPIIGLVLFVILLSLLLLVTREVKSSTDD